VVPITVEPALVVATDRDRDVEVYAMRSDGSGLQRLTVNPGRDYSPRWSRDGERIAFSIVRAGAPAEIWVMNADGSGQRQVTSLGNGASYPDWSPDGTRIVFQAARADGGSDIHVINADGTGLQQQTSGDAYAMPRWSPDGSRIAMVRCITSGEECLGDLVLMSAEDGSSELLSGAGMGGWPEWSPDGRRLAWASWRRATGQAEQLRITVMNADGSRRTVLTQSVGDEWSPAWSASSGRIYFIRGWTHYSMRVDGNDVRRVGAANVMNFVIGAR
jgi:Tol biopolymer transport system component